MEGSAREKIVVVIPAYNEAATIADVAGAVLALGIAVIVVNDGSTDATANRLDGLPLAVLRNPVNLGKGASLWRGMRHALATEATAVITMDGDGQHRAADLPRLIAAARAHPARVIIGTRTQQRERMPKVRRFGNGMADFWISWAAGWPIRDTQSGFRLYPAALIRRLAAARSHPSGFAFESEILIEASRAGFRPLAVPIETIYEAGARQSHYRPTADTLLIIRMVAGKLLRRGMDLPGLWRSQCRSLGTPPDR